LISFPDGVLLQSGMRSNLPTNEIARRKRERILMLASGIAVLVLSWVEYALISGSGPFQHGSNLLIFFIINLNTILILFLGFLIIRNLVKVVFEDRQNILGAKLRTKLVIAFVSLSLLPTLALFFVAFQFLSTSLSYWFDVRVEKSLESAIIVGKTLYDEQVRDVKLLSQNVERAIALQCLEKEGILNKECLKGIVEQITMPISGQGAIKQPRMHSLEVIDSSGKVLFRKYFLPLVDPPPPIPKIILERTRKKNKPVITPHPVAAGELIRVVSALPYTGSRPLYFVAVGKVLPQDMMGLLDDIRTGYEEYKQLRVFQKPIHSAVTILMLVVTFLILFVSVWFGFRLAKTITEPVQMLADATHRVAHGNLDFHLEAPGRDELSSLVRAFNTMTADLKEARAKAERATKQLKKSYAELERRQRYIEIILQNVAAGVISIDRRGVVTTVNKSAENILNISAEEVVGRPYQNLLSKEYAQEFEKVREELLLSGGDTVHRSMRLEINGKPLSLLVSFTLLKDAEGKSLGVVVVFDDLTELERIQRLAAWREVARRIAHEVKNPLTPIQLSAQRLRKRFGDKCSKVEDKEVFDRCTNTIISQVEDLKHLVNEFSNFARMPSASPAPEDINEIVKNILPIYQEMRKDIIFHKNLQEVPKALLDKDQAKRALVNIIENAIYSMKDGGEITITTGYNVEKGMVYLSVADTGSGISEEDKPRLLEPYFSKRAGGTGLGLAIVNSIMQDHGGSITIEDNVPHGTIVTLWFPSAAEDEE